jgi:hypothetical protein
MNHLDQRIFDLSDRIEKILETYPEAELISGYPILYLNYTLMVDLIIRRSGELLAVFELKPYEKRLILEDMNKMPVDDNPIAKYRVLTNGVQIFVRNEFTKSVIDFKTAEQLVSYIFEQPSSTKIELERVVIAKALEDEGKAFFIDNPGEQWEDRMKEFLSFQRIFDDLHYDKNGQFFRLGTDIRGEDNFENQLFNILLDDVGQNQKVYRYTALDTLFATVKYKNIRMNGIAGMNDPSELDYANRYFDQKFSIFSDRQQLKVANQRFITCCSELNDNLSQWRLYGDDCQGACLIFRLQQSQYSAGMRIKKVSYGKKKDGIIFHPELELLKRLLTAVSKNTEQSLKLKSLGIWKHFFKPYEYTEEKEVRILVSLNEGNFIKGSTQAIEKVWNLTNSHKIIVPYIEIPLHDDVLPIRLERIILGSKCPEKALNLVQLEIMLDENQLGDIKINQSHINNYR